MACVLTVVVVDDGGAVVGHVGDTRLYKMRRGRIEKVTRDHSPVGEREDAQELPSAKRCSIRVATRCTATSARSVTSQRPGVHRGARDRRSSRMPHCCSAATA